MDMEWVLKISRVVWSLNGYWIPILLIIIARYVSGAENIFRMVYITADEIEAITDAILEEFEDLDHVQTVSDIAGEVKEILKSRYSNIDSKKIDNQVENYLKKKEGLEIKVDRGKAFIDYTKRF